MVAKTKLQAQRGAPSGAVVGGASFDWPKRLGQRGAPARDAALLSTFLPPGNARPNRVEAALNLQRTIGNRAVLRLLRNSEQQDAKGQDSSFRRSPPRDAIIQRAVACDENGCQSVPDEEDPAGALPEQNYTPAEPIEESYTPAELGEGDIGVPSVTVIEAGPEATFFEEEDTGGAGGAGGGPLVDQDGSGGAEGASGAGYGTDAVEEDDRSLWEQVGDYFRESETAQFVSGLGAGGLAGAAPGGFALGIAGEATGAAEELPRSFRMGYGLGEAAWGVAQVLGGGTGVGLGIGASATGAGAVVGVPAVIGSGAVVLEGVADYATGTGIFMSAYNEAGGRKGPEVPELRADGKVHNELPNHVPENWSPTQLRQLEADLQSSIATRKAEQIRLGEHGPHRERLRQEERLLRQLKQKIKDG